MGGMDIPSCGGGDCMEPIDSAGGKAPSSGDPRGFQRQLLSWRSPSTPNHAGLVFMEKTAGFVCTKKQHETSQHQASKEHQRTPQLPENVGTCDTFLTQGCACAWFCFRNLDRENGGKLYFQLAVGLMVI